MSVHSSRPRAAFVLAGAQIALLLAPGLTACGDDATSSAPAGSAEGNAGTGSGSSGAGGANVAGSSSGGSTAGGASTSGGSSAGGSTSGGSSAGGSTTGGASASGGSTAGGSAGSSAGGTTAAGSGGTASGGAAGAAPLPGSCAASGTAIGAGGAVPRGDDPAVCPWPDFESLTPPSLPPTSLLCRGTWSPPAEPVFPAKTCAVDVVTAKIDTSCKDAPGTTAALQKAIDDASAAGCGHLSIPAGCYLIGQPLAGGATWEGLRLPSNLELQLDAQATLQMATTNTANSCAVAIRKAQNVGITGGTILGDRLTHQFKDAPKPPSDTKGDGKGDSDAFLVCIDQVSSRVRVEGVTFRLSNGDGVAIIADDLKTFQSNTDITIRKNRFEKNRRNGITIVGGIRVAIEENDISTTEGFEPQSGIDIESTKNAAGELLYVDRDVVIRRNRFFQNKAADVILADGENVLIEDNQMANGCLKKTVDASVIVWKRANATVRRNKQIYTSSSSNGLYTIMAYSVVGKTPDSPFETLVYGNAMRGGGVYFYDHDQLEVSKNRVENGGSFAFKDVLGLQLRDNELVTGTKPTFYRFDTVTGSASGNLHDGAAKDIPLSDEPYTKNWQ